jgi:hypothetical protein
MGRIKTVLTMVLVVFTLVGFSQKKDSVKIHLNHYTLTIGTGWTHYINNLEYGDQKIKQDFLGVSFKFYWEPEHRLSLGLESGYYKLFKITDQVNADTSIQFDRTVVPMLFLARMRIVDNVYLGAGFGLAFITNKAAGISREIITKTTSLSNFELSAAYIYPLSKHWLVGGECKGFHFGNLDDWMYSIQVVCAVKL